MLHPTDRTNNLDLSDDKKIWPIMDILYPDFVNSDIIKFYFDSDKIASKTGRFAFQNIRIRPAMNMFSKFNNGVVWSN